MINRLTYYLFVFVAVLAAACSHIDEMESPVPDQNLVMRFDMGCDTKVSNDDITSQEFIVYDYIYGASSEGYPDGTCYIDGSKVTLKYRDGSWGFYHNNSDTRVDFLWTKTGTHEFFAYNEVNYYWLSWTNPNYLIDFTFKYNGAHSTLSASSSINMLYPTDGIASKGYSQDFIYAYVSRDVESEDGFGPVSLEFGHAFSSVQITVKNNSWVTKNIEDLKLSQIRCNTGTGAAPSIDFSGTVSFNPGDLGDYPSSGKSLDHGDVWEVFDNPMVVLPQSVDHAVHNIQWTENGNYKYINIRDLETTSWDSGKLYHYVITLDPTELILEPTATIDTEDAGGNKFSVVNVNLNAPDGELQRITSLLITVTDPESNVIKTYEAATVVSNEISMECDELLAPGTYTVSVAYHDGLKSQSVSTTAVSEDTAVQPAVGYYVNNDGTFSETFISGYSIAKIFWTGDPTLTDTKLGDMYPDCKRGLAYEVDENGDLKVKNGYQWTTFNYNTAGLTWGTYNSTGDTDRICGFNNTYYIKKAVTTYIMADFDLSSSSYTGVSPWYLPSFKEYKEVRSNDSGASTIIGEIIAQVYPTIGFVISTLQADTTCKGQYVDASDTINQNSSTTQKRSYFRILAF